MSYPNAVKRTYTVTQNGASGFTATLRLHYRDAELNGNTDSLLDLWRFHGTAWNRVVKTQARDERVGLRRRRACEVAHRLRG